MCSSSRVAAPSSVLHKEYLTGHGLGERFLTGFYN